MKKFKLAIEFFLTIAFVLSVCVFASAEQLPKFATEPEKTKWKSDALAYIDEMIQQSNDESDIIDESGFSVIIRDADTMERIKIYIRNGLSGEDMTGIPRKPSATPGYTLGKMPWSNYEGFEYAYENPYQLISFGFTQSDRNELRDYLTRVIAESNLGQFSDVSQDDWFCYDVAYAYTYCRMKGTSENRFSPYKEMTRGAFAAALAPNFLEENEYADSGFEDVARGDEYYDVVAWAKSVGIVSGSGDGRFYPDAHITRQDMAVMFYRYEQSLEFRMPAAVTDAEFADQSDISDYARDAVETLAAQGIIGGKSGKRFDPKSTVTRAETAALLRKYSEAMRRPSQ
jgi:hypothetical protein